MFDLFKEPCGSFSILDRSFMNDHIQEQSQRIDQQVTFSPLIFCPASESRGPFFRGRHALALSDGCTGTDCTGCSRMPFLAEGIMNLLPCPIQTPLPVGVMHGSPWRQITREPPPKTAIAGQREHTLQDFPQMHLSASSSRFCWGKQGLNSFPLGITQIRRIRLLFHSSVSSVMSFSLPNPVL